MTGAKVPVLEVEKLTLTRDGRGLYVYNDGDILTGGPLTGISGTAIEATTKFLPAASCTRFLKITYVSGTEATETTGYIPILANIW